MVDQLVRLLTLQDANTRIVLVGTTLLGVAAGVIGCFAVLRRRSLVGDAVAHAALPGVCLSFLIVGDRHFAAFMLGALVTGMVAAAFISFVKTATRIKEDAAIALAIGGFFGLGIVLSRVIQNQASGNRAGLDSFIFGKAATMVAGDAGLIAAVAAAVLVAIAVFYKEFKILCFDKDFAASQGWPALTLDLGLMALVCICTVVGLPAVGVVLMVSLLVIPPAAARFWTERLGTMVLLAGVFGGLAGLLGTALSATIPAPSSGLSRGWPTGPLITLVAAATFAVSMIAAPRRGIVSDVVRRATLRSRISGQNFLRRLYELLEPGGDLSVTWTAAEIQRRDGAGTSHLNGQIRSATRAGLVAPRAEGFALTARGQAAAASVVRTHRLWEIFLITQADIAADHVDRDADQIEHVLSPEILASLEAKLTESGRIPLGVPVSPHETGGGRKG